MCKETLILTIFHLNMVANWIRKDTLTTYWSKKSSYCCDLASELQIKWGNLVLLYYKKNKIIHFIHFVDNYIVCAGNLNMVCLWFNWWHLFQTLKRIKPHISNRGNESIFKIIQLSNTDQEPSYTVLKQDSFHYNIYKLIWLCMITVYFSRYLYTPKLLCSLLSCSAYKIKRICKEQPSYLRENTNNPPLWPICTIYIVRTYGCRNMEIINNKIKVGTWTGTTCT